MAAAAATAPTEGSPSEKVRDVNSLARTKMTTESSALRFGGGGDSSVVGVVVSAPFVHIDRRIGKNPVNIEREAYAFGLGRLLPIL